MSGFCFSFSIVLSNLAFEIFLWSKIIGTCNSFCNYITRANFSWVGVQCVQTICYIIKLSKQIFTREFDHLTWRRWPASRRINLVSNGLPKLLFLSFYLSMHFKLFSACKIGRAKITGFCSFLSTRNVLRKFKRHHWLKLSGHVIKWMIQNNKTRDWTESIYWGTAGGL